MSDERKKKCSCSLLSKQVLLFALVALGFLVVSCGSSKSSKQTFDPQKASAEAHAILLKEAELPGSGWKITKEDQFNNDELPDSAVCQDMKSFKATTDKSQVSRARREFDRTTAGAAVPLSVDLDVHIYDNDNHVSSLLRQYKSLLDDGKLKPCLTESLQDQLKGAGALVNIKDATPLQAAPRGGIALAFDLSIGPVNFRAENYQWTVGNGVLESTFTGPKEAITSDLITATNQKLASAADQVAKGTRGQ